MKIIYLKFKMFDEVSEFVYIEKMEELIEYFELQIGFSKEYKNIISRFSEIFTNGSKYVAFEIYRKQLLKFFLANGYLILNKDGAIFFDKIEKYFDSDKVEYTEIIEID